MPEATLYHGDAVDFLRSLPDASVDAVVTDPPYAEVSRPYGRLTEPQWHALMDAVVTECRRVLRPKGSAVFVIRPNSECVGKMRLWVWEFMVKWGKAWGIVQDAYWWNYTAMPQECSMRRQGLRLVWSIGLLPKSG